MISNDTSSSKTPRESSLRNNQRIDTDMNEITTTRDIIHLATREDEDPLQPDFECVENTSAGFVARSQRVLTELLTMDMLPSEEVNAQNLGDDVRMSEDELLVLDGSAVLERRQKFLSFLLAMDLLPYEEFNVQHLDDSARMSGDELQLIDGIVDNVFDSESMQVDADVE
jgi:hypothetical protein